MLSTDPARRSDDEDPDRDRCTEARRRSPDTPPGSPASLTLGFTALPYRAADGEPWSLLTDEALAVWLSPTEPKLGGERRRQTVAEAVAASLTLAKSAIVDPEDAVGVVAEKHGPWLVTNGSLRKGNLLGVSAPAVLP